jgi:glycosyltransferase involved in cell wall biosynthesis
VNSPFILFREGAALCEDGCGSYIQSSCLILGPPLSESQMTIKLLCIIEATTVTGPAKNLLNFARLVRSPEFAVDGAPPVEVSIVTFDRQPASEPRAVATGSYGSSFVFDPIATAPGSDTAFVAAARKQGIDVDVIHERFRFDARVLKQLRTIVARRAPDVIQTHMIKSHFLVKLSGLRKKHPWVAYHHGYTNTDRKMLLYNRLNRWSLPSADRVITVCGAFAQQLSRAGVRPERLSVRHNTVVPPKSLAAAEQRALRKKFGIAEDERVTLAIGRLSREKGHADLIHSIASVRNSNPELKLKLLLVGDGPERTCLQTLAKILALDEAVVFAGHVSDVAPFYAIADVLALPSHNEGSPNVLLEAMAAGLPVVATRVGGVPEIASEENALLVAPCDPQAFAAMLHQVLTTPGLAQTLSSNAKAHVLDHFSPSSHAQSLIRIYEELMSEPRAIARGSYTQRCHIDPVASTTPRGLPARGPRSAPGSETSA